MIASIHCVDACVCISGLVYHLLPRPQVLGVILIDACNQFLIFPFIPFLVRDQLSLAADDPNVPLFSGMLAAAYLFGQFACSPFYGALSERLGRRPVLLVCVVISTVSTVSPTAITNVTTTRVTTNPHLPMLGGCPEVLQKVAEFVGVVVGVELRHLRAAEQAIAEVYWPAEDWDPEDGDY